MNFLRTLLWICCFTTITLLIEAKEPKGEQPIAKVSARQTNSMDRRVSVLMANRVSFKKDMALKELAAINERIQLEAKESLMFPADELYGSNWDNQWVNPYHQANNIFFPDSFQIDCTTFTFPIDTMIRVTSKYGPRHRRMHKGIDLKVQIGDTIRAAFDGKIRIKKYERRGYGYYLVIRHPNGLETVYGHLSKFLVNINDIVRAGDPIALGGNTGRSTGSHLHFETRFLGKDIDPSKIIDFKNQVPIQDYYVFQRQKTQKKTTLVYTATSDNPDAYHRVKSGDTLGKIARIYGTTVNELCRINGIKVTSMLHIGQSICYNTSTIVAQPVVKKAPQDKIMTMQPEQIKEVYHSIKSGDTLGALAIKYKTSVRKLCELNDITQTTILRLGRSIRCS